MNNAQDRIVAQVAGKPIMESEIDATLMQMGQRAQSYNNPQGRAMILEQLINKKLFLLDAQRNLLEREPAFKEQLGRVKEELLASYNIQKAVEKVRVTDEEVKKYYDEHPEQFDAGDSFNASHILVDSEELAKELKAKIESGELTFENAAMEHSTCPSGKQGGSLGDFGKGQMVSRIRKRVRRNERGRAFRPREDPVRLAHHKAQQKVLRRKDRVFTCKGRDKRRAHRRKAAGGLPEQSKSAQDTLSRR